MLVKTTMRAATPGTPERQEQNRTLVNFAEVTTHAWHNGGGQTRELILSPPDAIADTFHWRLSLADIAAAGPFSTFPGIDRHFLVASPGQLELDIDGQLHLLCTGDVVEFRGEATVEATLTHGPTRNLNLMTRREACVGELRVEHLNGATSWEDQSLAALVILAGSVTLAEGRMLSPYDAVLLGPNPETASCSGATVAEIRIRPTGPTTNTSRIPGAQHE